MPLRHTLLAMLVAVFGAALAASSARPKAPSAWSAPASPFAQQPSGRAPQPLAAPQQRAAAAPELGKEDARKARQAYQRGRRAEQSRDWQAALLAYSQAFALAPQNGEFLLRRDIVRSHIVRDYTDRAERDAISGRLPEALQELQAAIAIDPGNPMAHERLLELQRQEPIASQLQLLGEPGSEIDLQPQPGKRSFNFRGDTRSAYQELARQFGVSASFDPDLRPRRARLQAADLDFFTAARVLGEMTGTFWSPLTSRLFFVAADTQQKHREYDPSVVRTFVLPGSVLLEQMTETLRVVREITGIVRAQLDPGTRELTLRGSPLAMNLAAKLIHDLEQPRAELVLEIEILEVDKTVARQLGITPPTSSTIITVNKQQIQEAEQSVQGLIAVLTQLFGQPSSLTGFGSAQIGSLVGSGNLSLSSLVPPVLAFGGGGSTFFAELPGAAANFSEVLSLVRSGRRVLLRAQDGLPASFFVGDRVPITLALLSSSLTSSQFIPGITSGAFPRTDFSTGNGPVAVTSADFRSDGHQDLAVVNQTDNTVSILLGNGDGTFGAKTDFPTGNGPIALAAADFNGDGHPDLAVVNRTDNTVSILLGNGDGTFQAKHDFPVGMTPTSIAVSDLNNDTHQDLVVTDQAANTVSVLLGNGDGTFQAKHDFPTGNAPTSVAIGDFNGDSVPDLAVANQNDNTVSILLGHNVSGTGDGTFLARTDFPTGTQPVAVTTADFNLDNRLDLAVADFSANTVSVLLGNGDGTFQNHNDFTTGHGPIALATGDFNVDGIPDIVVSDQSANTVSVLIGAGNGSFAPNLDLPTGSSPFGIVAADFNGDNRTDAAIANQGSNTVSVILNTASFVTPGSSTPIGNAQTPQNFFPGSEYVDVGLRVKATPRVHFDGDVTLHLAFEIRSLSAQTVNGIPVISNRTIEQTVRLRQNETTALSGIFASNETRAITGNPGLAQIPDLNDFTANHDTNLSDTELLILLTPRLVRLPSYQQHTLFAGHAPSGGTGIGIAPEEGIAPEPEAEPDNPPQP